MIGGKENIKTQQQFLLCLAAVYFFAFSSLFFQIPGLYGNKGLLPAHLQLVGSCEDQHSSCAQWYKQGECTNNPSWMKENCPLSCKHCQQGTQLSISAKFKKMFSLLWFTQYFGLSAELGMNILCVAGIILSFCILVSNRFCNQVGFATLWILYLSLYKAGQTFLWFQCFNVLLYAVIMLALYICQFLLDHTLNIVVDILLLETGFIAIILAPLKISKKFQRSQFDNVIFWLVKWLLFRLMFASGVVKLTSLCPTWWGLTALDWHYESQCIPTPIAWYAHQLPSWFQRLSVVLTFVIEIAVPFFFFAPLRSLRIFSFYSQMFLQVLIMASGNYTFFNLLTCTLCLSLIDDCHIQYLKGKVNFKFFKFLVGDINFEHVNDDRRDDVKTNGPTNRVFGIIKTISFCIVIMFLFYWTKIFFNLSLGSGFEITSKVGFSQHEFMRALTLMTKLSIAIAVFSLIVELGKALYRSVANSFVSLILIWNVTQFIFITSVTIWLFLVSLVPFTSIDKPTQQNVWPIVRNWYSHVEPYEIANSYGLFRRMTGVGGRPELIIEGANDLQGSWKEYNFKYKPGSVSQPMVFVFPHQPRLDWQMWFAALGSYNHNPWFIHLIYKLLHGEKDVLELLGENPFPNKPPKYIRSILYTYHYTKVSKNSKDIVEAIKSCRNIKNWWRRDHSPKEYTPPLHKDEPTLINFIEQNGWLKEEENDSNSSIHLVITKLRCLLLEWSSPTSFMWQMMLLAFLIRLLN